jgi:hypothetical protein
MRKLRMLRCAHCGLSGPLWLPAYPVLQDLVLNDNALYLAHPLMSYQAPPNATYTNTTYTNTTGYLGPSSADGSVPLSSAPLPLLQVLDLSFNQLNGTLPSDLTTHYLPMLRSLMLRGNALTGSIMPGVDDAAAETPLLLLPDALSS